MDRLRVPGAKIPLPQGFIAPCLPTATQRPPGGLAWVHEIKHDGYRLMAPPRRQQGPAVHPEGLRLERQVSLDSRGTAVASGPVVWAGRDGKSDFDRLHSIRAPTTTKCSCMTLISRRRVAKLASMLAGYSKVRNRPICRLNRRQGGADRQPQDSPGARPHCADRSTRSRRRSDRVAIPRCCTAVVRKWHEREVLTRAANVG